MSCKFCDFNRKGIEWEIELYELTSYEYDGKKYFLAVTCPADGRLYHRVKKVEVNYCPKCGRKLSEV